MWRDHWKTTMFIYDFSHAVRYSSDMDGYFYSGTQHFAALEIYSHLNYYFYRENVHFYPEIVHYRKYVHYHPKHKHDWESLIKVIFPFILVFVIDILLILLFIKGINMSN